MIGDRFKLVLWAVFFVIAIGTLAFSEPVTVRVADGVTVDAAISRIKGAVEKAGAQVFAIVNYQQGVKSVGQTIRPTTLIIFGSPKIGGAIFQEGQTFGLYLPLKILAHEDGDATVWLTYDDPAGAAVTHRISKDHPAITNMHNVLTKLTGVAAHD